MLHPYITANIELHPDIVYDINRLKGNGVLICVRNDGEKKYTNEEIDMLKYKLELDGLFCEISDTNSDVLLNELVSKFDTELDKLLDAF